MPDVSNPILATPGPVVAEQTRARRRFPWWRDAKQYLRRNRSLAVGLLMLVGLLGASALGALCVDLETAQPLSAPVSQSPNTDYPFGTDAQGRDLLAVIIIGTWLTCKVGLIAGAMGVVIGATVGFVAGYARGWIDRLICLLVDVGLTVPPLLFLVVVASAMKGGMSSTSMALMIGGMAWLAPARQIRAQALVMREANYIQMARMSGAGSAEIIFGQMMPNLLPFLMACFVVAVSQAILAAVGVEALGLGPAEESTLGMTIYWMMFNSAFIRGLWWWIAGPIVVLITLFVSLYLISAGMDEFANPRLRTRKDS